jgi:alpha-mannosidase
VHIAFPFAVPNGQVRYDVAGAVVRPGEDQLPGSCKNFFSVNSWVDVSAADYGITLATPDIPLAEFGQMTAEQPWRTDVASGTAVYSYVLNNYWHTNFRADQSGMIDFHYALKPHGPFDATNASNFGQDQREPLIVVPAWVKK